MTIKNLIIFGTTPEAIEQADIIAYLVALKEFKNLKPASDKIILDFCGINNRCHWIEN